MASDNFLIRLNSMYVIFVNIISSGFVIIIEKNINNFTS